MTEHNQQGLFQLSHIHRSFESSWNLFRWVLGGIALVGLQIVLAFLSPRFAYGRSLLTQPVLTVVALMCLSGVLYWLIVSTASEKKQSAAFVVWIIFIGVGLRIAQLAATPILEDDYYRYLWDGAVTAHGISPYGVAPQQMISGDTASGPLPSTVRQLAADAQPLLRRINNPRLRTIYPPVAQAAFALAHWIQPWSLLGWRWVLLAFDLATLVLLIALLRTMGLPLQWLAIYWWNPLLVKEVFNSGHMDVIALPFVLGAVWLAIRGRRVWAAAVLGLAVGAKVWPIVLLPIILRPVANNLKPLVAALGLFSLVAFSLFLPIYVSGFDSSSGFVAYGQVWESNDALFLVLRWGLQGLLQTLSAGLGALQIQLLARIFLAVIVSITLVKICWKPVLGPRDECERGQYIVATLFLLSPTQFPWYYVWLLPFLSIRPRRSLLLLTALLPFYYLRYYFEPRNHLEMFRLGIVWLEYVPVWYLLFREWLGRGARLTRLQEATV